MASSSRPPHGPGQLLEPFIGWKKEEELGGGGGAEKGPSQMNQSFETTFQEIPNNASPCISFARPIHMATCGCRGGWEVSLCFGDGWTAMCMAKRTYQWKNGYYNRPGISKLQGIPGGSAVKNLSANAGDMGLISMSGRFPGEGNGKPLQYSCLGNPVDRGTWWPPVHGVEKSQTWLSN